ncbi:AIPR family protein [Nocardiopsis salina]|uniref:AIPR family protein n=1 Tax=Nocardiopsis salina TaxID=245836 RepID=UPI0003476D1A|nr:AIPR family protein [Nocardiopsis salina]
MPHPRRSSPRNDHAIRQIKHVLDQELVHLVDMSDFERNEPDQHQKALYSRALAALAVRGQAGVSSNEAADSLIDGRDDHGIDAIAVSETTSRIWLVQAKWNDQGRAGFKQNEALKFQRGWKLLENREFDRFNDRIQNMADRVHRVLLDPHARVHFVVAVSGDGNLSRDVTDTFDEIFEETNGYGLKLDLQVVGTHALLDQIRADRAPEDVPIVATLDQWIHVDTPAEMYQGIAQASQVAEWVNEVGGGLFARNIRASLGTTDVNSGIMESLTEDPEHFLFLHNGITVICEGITAEYPKRRRQSEEVRLTLERASVVNGAQTVTTLHRAFQEHPDEVAEADISLHVICVSDRSSLLPTRITDTRNRQNRVEDRDFVALDETQALIREDFGTQDLAYTYKRGEPDPVPEHGCSVVEAAVALACAHPNVKLAVRAKQNVDSLWEQGADGAYPLLFGVQPSVHQIWGSVRLRRAVGDHLHGLGKKLRGRGSDMADRADLLVTHLVFRFIGGKETSTDDFDWDSTLERAGELVDTVFPWLLHHVDSEYVPDKTSLTRTLADPTRCRELGDLVLRDVLAQKSTPDIDTAYRLQQGQRKRKPRRPNSVAILMDAGMLNSGVPLEYRPTSANEEQALKAWLDEDERRSRATWTHNRSRPLLWESDGAYYSPSGLVMRMYELAGWENAPVAVQGPAKWNIDGRSIAEHAERIFADLGKDG